MTTEAERKKAINTLLAMREWPDTRAEAWERIATHPFFEECYKSDDPLIDAVLAKLDDWHRYETALNESESERRLPLHRTEAGWPNCATCDGGGCLDCTDPAY